MDFHKYQGNGNDFVLIDNRSGQIDIRPEVIHKLCDRRFGIGSDGLVLIQDDAESDFEMVFYNPDASQSFCGNGSRCAVHFAHGLGLIKEETYFRTTDGLHRGWVKGDQVRISIADVPEVVEYPDCYFANTGSPHAVLIVEDVDSIDVASEGRRLRMDPRFAPGGCNVNFVQLTQEGIKSRVFERGVEGETLSSGSGTTAQAICAHFKEPGIGEHITVQTRGGELEVEFKAENGSFGQIYLSGPICHVFSGQLTL